MLSFNVMYYHDVRLYHYYTALTYYNTPIIIYHQNTFHIIAILSHQIVFHTIFILMLCCVITSYTCYTVLPYWNVIFYCFSTSSTHHTGALKHHTEISYAILWFALSWNHNTLCYISNSHKHCTILMKCHHKCNSKTPLHTVAPCYTGIQYFLHCTLHQRFC